MARLIADLFSWLHTTTTGYDYESIEPVFTTNYNLFPDPNPSLRPMDSLQTLRWPSTSILCKISRKQSSDLQRTKQHKSPILKTIKRHPSWNEFTKPAGEVTLARPPTSKFDTLPTELKLAIITRLPSVDAYHQISLTSKSFHEVRMQHHPFILPFVLHNELGQPIFEEAYFVARAARIDFSHGDYVQRITAFLDEWKDYDPGSVRPDSVPLQTIIEMAKLHQSVKALVADFCSWAVEGFVGLKCGPSSCIHPSASETVRITRAFYRLELYCALYKNRPMIFDDDIKDSDEVRSRHIAMKRQAYEMFDNWDAWENEEIACVRDYVFARLANFFHDVQVAASVNPFNIMICMADGSTRLPDPVNLPSGTLAFWAGNEPSWYDEQFDCGVDLSPQGHLNELQELYLSQGCEFLSRAFSSTHPQKQVDTFLSKWNVLSHNDDGFGFLTRQLEEIPLRMRIVSREREAFFHGDTETFETDEGAVGPNFAWTFAGGQKYQPFYASIERSHHRRWGYVMWDHERLIASSACQETSTLPDIDRFYRCYTSLVEAHNSTCRRRSQEITVQDREDAHTPVTAEEDEISIVGDSGGQMDSDNESLSDDQGVFLEDPELQTEQVAESRQTDIDSVCSSASTSPLSEISDRSYATSREVCVTQDESGSEVSLATPKSSLEAPICADSIKILSEGSTTGEDSRYLGEVVEDTSLEGKSLVYGSPEQQDNADVVQLEEQIEVLGEIRDNVGYSMSPLESEVPDPSLVIENNIPEDEAGLQDVTTAPAIPFEQSGEWAPEKAKSVTAPDQEDRIDAMPAPVTENTSNAMEVAKETLFDADRALHHESLAEPPSPVCISKEAAQFRMLPEIETQLEPARQASLFGRELQINNDDVQQDSKTADMDVTVHTGSPAAHEILTMETTTHPKIFTNVQPARKLARAVSPKQRMLKIQQGDAQKCGYSTSNSTSSSQPIQFLGMKPEYTDDHGRTASPSLSECFSSRSDSHPSTKSEASSKTFNGSPGLPIRDSHLVSSPPRRWIMRGRKVQPRRVRAHSTSEETEHELDNKIDPDVKSNDDNNGHYLSADALEDNAARVREHGTFELPLLQRTMISRPSSESGAGKDDNAAPTKQQRKKANRKARKAAVEVATKQDQEMEAEKLRKEEAKKEHQKLKKERKKLEVGKGKGKGMAEEKVGTGNTEIGAGKTGGKKGRKTGYLIG